MKPARTCLSTRKTEKSTNGETVMFVTDICLPFGLSLIRYKTKPSKMHTNCNSYDTERGGTEQKAMCASCKFPLCYESKRNSLCTFSPQSQLRQMPYQFHK